MTCELDREISGATRHVQHDCIGIRENVFERGRRVAIRYRTPILLVVGYLLMRITLLAAVGR